MGTAVSTSVVERARSQARLLYYVHLAPRRGVTRRTEPSPTLEEWLGQLGAPERIVVVAAGPTASTLRPRAGSLHVGTNSSESVVAGHPYVNFLSELYPVARYQKRGPVSASCRGTFYRFETADRPALQAEVARRAIRAAQRYQRAAPDIVASDVDGGQELANYRLFEDRVAEHLGQAVRQYNSGFGATYLGYFLAVSFGVPLELYGLDAGVGGEKHFDGSQMSSPSVVGDRVRTKLAALHELLQAQPHVPVTNHSAFLPTQPGA